MLRKLKLPFFWANVVKLASGSMISQLFVIILTPFITRLYTPEDYGILGVINSVSGVIIIVAALRLERAIILVKGKESNKLLNVCNLITLIITILVFLLLCVFRDSAEKVFELKFKILIFAVPIIIFLNGILNSYKSFGNSVQLYGVLSISIILNSVLSSSLKLSLGYFFKPSASLLIFSEITAVFITTLFLFFSFKNKISFFKIVFPKKTFVKQVLSNQKDFLRFDIIGSLLNALSWMLPILLLSFFFDKTIVGFYTLGFTMLRLPMNLLGKAIGNVFYKTASDTKDIKTLSKSTLDVVKKLFKFGVLPILYVLFFGNYLFIIVFGQQWEEAGVYSQILSLWTLIWFVSSPISNLYYVLKQQKNLLIFTVVSLILRVCALSIGGYYKDPYLALILFSIVSFIIYSYQLFYLLNKVDVRPRQLTITLFREFKKLVIPIILLIFLFYFYYSILNLVLAGLVIIVSLGFDLGREIIKKKK